LYGIGIRTISVSAFIQFLLNVCQLSHWIITWYIARLCSSAPCFRKRSVYILLWQWKKSTFFSDSERTFSHPHKSKITVLGFVLSPFSFKMKAEKQIVPTVVRHSQN